MRTVASIDAAVAMLIHATCALVLTDGFSQRRGPSLGSIAGLVQAAGGTPVVFVSAYHAEEVELWRRWNAVCDHPVPPAAISQTPARAGFPRHGTRASCR